MQPELQDDKVQLQVTIGKLYCNTFRNLIDQEEIQYNKDQQRWEDHINNLIAMGAGDRATAIRWDMQAEDATNGGHYDVGYYCYLKNIRYNNEEAIRSLLG